MPPEFLASSQFQSGLAALLEAAEAAADCNVNRWVFALEVAGLTGGGMKDTFLRWLICQDYALHGIERATLGKARRPMHRVNAVTFRQHSCVILNDAGVEFARQILRSAAAVQSSLPPIASAEPRPQAVAPHLVPRWDAKLRQLLIGETVVIRFSGRRGNQELILASFQEEMWPDCIDDPLPGNNGSTGKQRLRGAVEKLNARQHPRRINFSCDGTGEAIRWRLIGNAA